MTAEIVVMNLDAVAMAADSAVTYSRGSNQKIFPSANKLFGLSDVAPVGVMFYGNASILGLPWETIMKEYRRSLGTTIHANLEGYADGLVKFVEQVLVRHVPEDVQGAHAMSQVAEVFGIISSEIRTEILRGLGTQAGPSASTSLSDADNIKAIGDQITRDYHLRAVSPESMRGVPSDLLSTVRQRYAGDIRDLRREVFPAGLLSAGASNRLTEIGVRVVAGYAEDISHRPSGTGVVIAGFGEEELFPVVLSMKIDGMICNQLKYRNDDEDPPQLGHAGHGSSAAILPYAQGEMVHLFMEGIDPIYQIFLDGLVHQTLDRYAGEVVDALEHYLGSDKSDVAEILRGFAESTADRWRNIASDYRGQNFAQEIMGVVPSLPKDQLAEMAESLVSLTSFRRHVSWQEETVGGPIDVAVISKGDGFVWIKRKHYFPSELNPAYFSRRFSSSDTISEQKQEPKGEHGG